MLSGQELIDQIDPELWFFVQILAGPLAGSDKGGKMLACQSINLVGKARIREEQMRGIFILLLVLDQPPIYVIVDPLDVKVQWSVVNHFLNGFDHLWDDLFCPIGGHIGEFDTQGRLTIFVAEQLNTIRIVVLVTGMSYLK